MIDTQLEEILDVYTSDEEIEVGTGRKPNGYWKDRDNFNREVREAIESNGGMRPSRDWLRNNGYGSLVTAANDYHGGLKIILDEITSIPIRKPMEYWKIKSNFENELNEAIKDNKGERPTKEWLVENGYSNLVNAAFRHYGGITIALNNWAKNIDKKDPKGYLMSKEHFYEQVKIAIEKNHGERPTREWLIENGFGALEHAANRYHGGFKSVLDIATNSSIKNSNGYWQDRNNFDRELSKAIKANDGQRPTVEWLNENGFSSIVNAAKKYYGGITTELNTNTGKIKNPKGYWKNENNFFNELKIAVEANNGQRPTQDWLNGNGFGKIVNAARRYYIGISYALDKFFEQKSEEDPLGLLLEEYVGGEE